MIDSLTRAEFNREPVFFCKHCLSLNVQQDEFAGDYCADCGKTDIRELTLSQWEQLYKDKYGYKFLESWERQKKKKQK